MIRTLGGTQNLPLCGSATYAFESSADFTGSSNPGRITSMLKAIAAITFTALGAGATGVAVHIQNEPRAFTTPKPALLESAAHRVARRTVVRRERFQVVAPPEDDVVRGEIVIYARPMAQRIAAAQRRTDVALEPCSDWRELDPESKVRQLCQPAR
jgi:hypothetical protein